MIPLWYHYDNESNCYSVLRQGYTNQKSQVKLCFNKLNSFLNQLHQKQKFNVLTSKRHNKLNKPTYKKIQSRGSSISYHHIYQFILLNMYSHQSVHHAADKFINFIHNSWSVTLQVINCSHMNKFNTSNTIFIHILHR